MKQPIIKPCKLHSKCNKNKPYPRLNVSGRWLEESGFPIGQSIEMTIQDKQLTIKSL